MAELNYVPLGHWIGVSPGGHIHILVLQFVQKLEENIRSGSALVNLSRQGFFILLFPYGVNQIIQKKK